MRKTINNSQWWRSRTWAVPSLVRRKSLAGTSKALYGSQPVGQSRALENLRYPNTTLGGLLDQTAARFGDVPALIYGESRQTYQELAEQVNRIAAGLRRLEVVKGDRILMVLPNCPEFVAVFLAAQKLGSVLVNAGPLMGADDLRQLIAMTKPRLVVALDLQAPILAPLAASDKEVCWLWVSLKNYQTVWKRMGYRAKLWHSQHRNGFCGRTVQIEDLIANAPSRPPSVAPDLDDIAVLQPTGGTTGTLKVAQLSHRNLLANATQLAVCMRPRLGQERLLAILPMFHVYGLSTCLFTALFNASTLLPVTRFCIGQLLDVIGEQRPTISPLAPAILDPMCDELEQRPRPDVIEVFRGGIVTSGAAPLTPETFRRFEALTGVGIVQGYGLTEASPVTHANPMDSPRAGSIGLPLPDTQVRLADLQDSQRDAAAGEPGELLVSGPQVTIGYLDHPDETQRILSVDRNGRRWLHTGDVVQVDEDGFFYVIDRRKDMINRGGLKVYPAKVERILKMHAQVEDAAVVGRADAVHTEVVVAVLVLKEPAVDPESFVESLRAQCREHLAPYEVPQTFEFTDSLPRTALGKMQRYQLRDPAALERMEFPGDVQKVDGGNGKQARAAKGEQN